MIIDAFMFFNELDTLEIRLRELSPVVDLFVLLECGETLAGQPKPFIFEENKSRYSAYINKIKHVKLLGLPPLTVDTEERRFWLESYQRNALMLGLTGAQLSLNDLVLISDVDEIPSRESVLFAAHSAEHLNVMIFKQTYYKSFFDMKLSDDLKGRRWLGTVAVRYSMFGEILPDALRLQKAHAGRFYEDTTHNRSDRQFIENAGWHMTYFGGEKALRYKVAHFAHGAKGASKDTKSTPVALVSRASLTGLKSFDKSLALYLKHVVTRQLSSDVPTTVADNLEDYYHLFLSAFNEKPLPWL